jgi:hypothetical protein
MSLKSDLMNAIPKLTERDFGNHETDLYVVAYPEVTKWLLKNYQFMGNVRNFTGNEKAKDWNGAGLPCYDIPFAHEKE